MSISDDYSVHTFASTGRAKEISIVSGEVFDVNLPEHAYDLGRRVLSMRTDVQQHVKQNRTFVLASKQPY